MFTDWLLYWLYIRVIGARWIYGIWRVVTYVLNKCFSNLLCFGKRYLSPTTEDVNDRPLSLSFQLVENSELLSRTHQTYCSIFSVNTREPVTSWSWDRVTPPPFHPDLSKTGLGEYDEPRHKSMFPFKKRKIINKNNQLTVPKRNNGSKFTLPF